MYKVYFLLLKGNLEVEERLDVGGVEATHEEVINLLFKLKKCVFVNI